MFKLVKNFNKKLEGILYNALPKEISNPIDSFAFKDDEEKNAVYNEILDNRRKLRAKNIKSMVYLYLLFLILLTIMCL